MTDETEKYEEDVNPGVGVDTEFNDDFFRRIAEEYKTAKSVAETSQETEENLGKAVQSLSSLLLQEWKDKVQRAQKQGQTVACIFDYSHDEYQKIIHHLHSANVRNKKFDEAGRLLKILTRDDPFPYSDRSKSKLEKVRKLMKQAVYPANVQFLYQDADENLYPHCGYWRKRFVAKLLWGEKSRQDYIPPIEKSRGCCVVS
jgi:hypothetical protein